MSLSCWDQVMVISICVVWTDVVYALYIRSFLTFCDWNFVCSPLGSVPQRHIHNLSSLSAKLRKLQLHHVNSTSRKAMAAPLTASM